MICPQYHFTALVKVIFHIMKKFTVEYLYLIFAILLLYLNTIFKNVLSKESKPITDILYETLPNTDISNIIYYDCNFWWSFFGIIATIFKDH